MVVDGLKWCLGLALVGYSIAWQKIDRSASDLYGIIMTARCRDK